MSLDQFHTPILFILFNRPDTTQKVFDQIRNVRPNKLFIAADGPRDTHGSDKEKCKKTREIVSQIDWPCEIKTLFHYKNLGCGHAPSRAITWFFEHVEEGIILEDDCLPNKSFFYFCQSMLEKYRYDSRIFQIAGTSHQAPQNNTNIDSYTFSRIPFIWGWATWKRAWKKYDFHLKTFPQFAQENTIRDIFCEEVFQSSWFSTFDIFYKNLMKKLPCEVWDFQWTYTILSQHGLCIVPTKNLICNLGFGPDATHTTTPNGAHSNRSTKEIDCHNLIHPTFILPNKLNELWVMEHIFNIRQPNGIIWETKKIAKERFPRLARLYRYCKSGKRI